MILEYGVYQLDIDADRTRHFYSDQNYEFCTCSGCRNFSEAYPMIPDVVQQFFQQFGIDIGKPAEITPVFSSDGNLTYYDGFYHICGTILKGKDPWIKIAERTFQLDDQYALKLTEHFKVFFVEKCAMVDKDFPAPAIQMEIQCYIPWVLDEPNPYFFESKDNESPAP